MPKNAATILSLGAAASAVGGAYKFGEFLNNVKRLHDVGPSNAVYVRLINRVRYDLDEVQRLLTVREVKDALAANPPKAKWVYGSIRDVRGALENITPLTERVAGDIENGRRVGLRHRLRWTLDEKEKLQNRELELNTVHGSLCEVLGWLTSLEPVEERRKTDRVDVEIRNPGRAEEGEVWVDQHERGPRRVEERETWVEHERGPRRVEEREAWVEHREGPRRVEERETWVEPSYHEHGPGQYEERRFEERRYEGGRPPRRSDEDRVPERETFMQSGPGRYQERYTEYRGPEGYGRPVGDPGFGDEEVLNPQPVSPMNRAYEREIWIEEKEDYRYDQYGNKLPDRFFSQTRYPRSRM
ncbi:hypothetical protein K469DRAFT_672591 [Zopfia rhizophila CBS 207.26]|uniref:Uncharacterized protein n=1 Tax=Zopfia rhizophila CBS 207.26 TaxID=1314779 RepID=A0A6A6DQJ4_9PEZI|nr:hypothetical protein K469DRAFT_672591 [Zopfia rhizophila CBS 207.26]